MAVKGSLGTPLAGGARIGSALLLLSLAAQAWASGTISGKLTGALPNGASDWTSIKSTVIATNDKNGVFSAAANADGSYSISSVDNGTYKVVAVAQALAAPAVTNLVISDTNATGTANFAMVTPTPFPILQAAGNNPIPLTDGIDSASFKDAPEIDLNSGEAVSTGDRSSWGGPSIVSGRFKIKYSSLGLHVAADVTYKTPRVNDQTGGNIWNANALEVDFQNDAYDPTRTSYMADHNWQFGLGLGKVPDWYLWGSIQAHPTIKGADTAVGAYALVTDKTPNTGETFRVDIPWEILLDSNKNGISEPANGALGGLDLALDAADPTQPIGTSTASSPLTRSFQLTWSGQSDTWTDPASDVPVQFVTTAPTTLGVTGGIGDVKLTP